MVTFCGVFGMLPTISFRDEDSSIIICDKLGRAMAQRTYCSNHPTCDLGALESSRIKHRKSPEKAANLV